MIVSPDGSSVYVASETSRSVSIFGREGATGQISQLPGTQGCTPVLSAPDPGVGPSGDGIRGEAAPAVGPAGFSVTGQ